MEQNLEIDGVKRKNKRRGNKAKIGAVASRSRSVGSAEEQDDLRQCFQAEARLRVRLFSVRVGREFLGLPRAGIPPQSWIYGTFPHHNGFMFSCLDSGCLTGKAVIKDLFSDLKDGRKLLDLLEGLTGTTLTKERGFTRVHALNNVNRVLQVLHQNSLPDKKSIIMYVTSLFAVLPNDVTMDDIWEVETLPRKYKVDEDQQAVSMQGLAGAPVEVGRSPAKILNTDKDIDLEVGMDLDSYQAMLEEVLTWLLSAEDALHMQDEVSDDVEEVKDQFHMHEEFMMELTAHQSSVGNVLQVGNQLIAQGSLSEEEEDEIREQMTLLNSRWEALRVDSMDRQAKLHEVLMALQHQQLQQLSDWLKETEGRIRKMETEPMAGDMPGYLAQIEQHRALQSDLEAEQVKVNSLTHMVVVVDENSGEGATAALEDQLQSLGERWAAVCRWTEERWTKLEEILPVWQQLLDDQNLFRAWLAEKEKALSEAQTSDFKDPSEINANVRRLATLKEDMAQKRRALGTLSEAGQDVAQLLKSPEARQRIETDTEELTQRWDNLVQRLEDCSNQVTVAVSVADGLSSSLLRSAIVSANSEFCSSQQLLKNLQDGARFSEEVSSLSKELKVLDGALLDSEAWQNRTAGRLTDANLSALHTLRHECQAQLAELQSRSARFHQLQIRAASLASEPGVHTDIQSSVRGEEVSRWLDGVQELLSEDSSPVNHADKLQEELNQCKEYVEEMEGVEASLNQVATNVAAVQQSAVPGLATWWQKELEEKQSRWDALSKQEVWSCWMELLQYLDLESGWLNTLDETLQATEKLPENSDAISQALESIQADITAREVSLEDLRRKNAGNFPAPASDGKPARGGTMLDQLQGLLKESDSKKADLCTVTENSAALQAIVEGSETQLEDQLFVLNEGWQQVRTLTEDWLSAVLALLTELESMSTRVDGARDQAVILMTSRGPACRDVVEPKLEDLNRNFHKVAQHIKAAQCSLDLERSIMEDKEETASPLSSSEMQEFETDLLATLNALEQQESTHTPDEDKEIHIIRTHRIREDRLSSSPSSSPHVSEEQRLSLSPSSFLLDVNKVTALNEHQSDVIQNASRQEVEQATDALTQLNAEWDRVNRMYSQRKGSFDRAVEEWRQFHCDLNDLSQWLCDAEQTLDNETGPEGDPEHVSAQQELIIPQLSSPGGPLLQDKLDSLTQRCAIVHNQVTERRRRLLSADPSIAEVLQRSADLARWLEQTEDAVLRLPTSAADQNLRELKVSQELLEKVREVEVRLQFQERMNHLSNWVHLTQQPLSGPTELPATEAQALESAMMERRKELEELFTRSTELHKNKQLHPQEKRHPQLEEIFTQAQNIKNKTSDLDVRTSITEKLEKVRGQWDSTQHGVEARLLQLDHMTTHSVQWQDQWARVKTLIGQNEARLHNLLQTSREPLTKQIGDNKALLQELSRDHVTVAAFNELCTQILHDYADDDTRRVKEAVLDSELKNLQVSLRELEGFLKWLQEAETTVNVLADASQREELSQDSAHVRELKNQLDVSTVFAVWALTRRDAGDVTAETR
ncbi:Utrophin [Bagarius yarrelli]|uniref:Utrophin n=1 Tax=Bagarius yarrelli TaxID=175774 RepID=A0A556U075_BAGYA|nr:Utrophin [Bagarius yarrelli]